MKITVTVSHDFENVQAAIAFAAKLEPITKELEAPSPALTAAPVTEAIEAKPAIDREHAETLNPSLADQLPEVQPSKRTRRTKAEMEAARAAEEATAPPAPPASKAAPVADIDPFDIAFGDDATPANVVRDMTEDEIKVVWQEFARHDGWRPVLLEIFKELKIEKIRDIPPAKRRYVATRFEKHIAASKAA